MTGWLRAVWRELRHGTCLFALPAVGVLTTAVLWSKGYDWGTRWNDLGRLLREVTIVLGPVAVTLGAWQGGRAQRSEVTETLDAMPRAALTRSSTEIVALAIAVTLGVWIGWGTAAASILLVGGWGTTAAAWYFAGMAPTMLAYVTFGYALGRALSWRVVAPIAGLLTYVLIGLTAYRSDSLNAMVGSGRLGNDTFSTFQLDALLWSAVVLATAALGVWGLASTQRGPGRGRGWLMLGAVGVTAAVVSVPHALAVGDGTPYGKADIVCTTDEGPKVCVLAADKHSLDATTEAARKVLKRMDGIAGAPTWAGPQRHGSPLDPTQLPTNSVPVNPWGGVTKEWNSEYVDLYGLFDPTSHCPERFDFSAQRLSPAQEHLLDTFFRSYFPVAQWLTEELHADPEERLAVRFQDAPDAQKREYAGRILAAARTCDEAAANAAHDILPKG